MITHVYLLVHDEPMDLGILASDFAFNWENGAPSKEWVHLFKPNDLNR